VPTRLSDRACVFIAAALILLAAGLRVAFLLNGPLDLAADEAHYWDWSRHPDWSYYSKGPLIAWVIGAAHALLGPLSEALTGNIAFAVRSPAVLFGSLLLVAMYTLAVQVARDHRLALALLAVLLTQPAISAGSTLMTIDSPYTCAWAWALVLTLHALRTDAGWAWVSAGAVVCLGVLAKYTMALFIPSLALYLLASRERRSLFLRPGPWLLVGVACLSAVPILVWNASHGWVTFQHLATLGGFGAPTQVSDGGLKWLGPIQYLGGQAALMLGVWLVFWLCAVWTYRPGKDGDGGRQFLWWLSVPMFVFFLGFSLKKGGGEINWPVTTYLSGAVLSAIWLAEVVERGVAWQRKLATAGAVAGVAVGGLGVVLMHFSGYLYPVLGPFAGEPGPKEPFPMRRIDPTCRLRGWRELAAEVDRVMDELGDDVVLAGSGWTMPGMLGVYCHKHPHVYCLGSAQGERLSQYDLWPNPIDQREGFLGKTFVVVGSPDPVLRAAFDSVEERPPVRILVSGRPVASHGVWVCRGFRGIDRRSAGH
jgi:4-amino-4-deoxy-L-arabinose transferase-like glycosyltransferase